MELTTVLTGLGIIGAVLAAYLQIRKEIEAAKTEITAVLKERIESHSRDSEAHSRAVPRIGTLESDFQYVRETLTEIKQGVTRLLEARE